MGFMNSQVGMFESESKYLSDIIAACYERVEKLRRDFEVGILPEPVYYSLFAKYTYIIKAARFRLGEPVEPYPSLLAGFSELFSEYSKLVRRLSWYTLIVILAFFVGVHLGVNIGVEEAAAVVESLRGRLNILEYPPLLMLYLIFSNNFAAQMSYAVYGFFLGLPPLISAGYNGYIVGAVFIYAIFVQGRDPLTFFSLILPHGLLELTAVFTSFAAGMRAGIEFLRWRGPKPYIMYRLGRDLAVVLAGNTCFLLLAAFIEAFITPLPPPAPDPIYPILKILFGLGVFTFYLVIVLGGRRGNP